MGITEKNPTKNPKKPTNEQKTNKQKNLPNQNITSTKFINITVSWTDFFY